MSGSELARAQRHLGAQSGEHGQVRHQERARLLRAPPLEGEQAFERECIQGVHGQPVVGFRRECDDLAPANGGCRGSDSLAVDVRTSRIHGPIIPGDATRDRDLLVMRL